MDRAKTRPPVAARSRRVAPSPLLRGTKMNSTPHPCSGTRIAAIGALIAAGMSLASAASGGPAVQMSTDSFGWNFEYDQGDRVTR